MLNSGGSTTLCEAPLKLGQHDAIGMQPQRTG